MTKHILQYANAENPCTYKQVEYLRSFDNVKMNIRSTSQLLKRLEMYDIENLIKAAQNGEEILLTDK